jgi:peptidoglycan/LPS O-acetylase OafA/YrhL
MGILRFLLACSVIVAHSQPLIWGNLPFGGIAVQAFFIISGFYMALVLCEKYTGTKHYWLFISNRILRLWPAYIIILAVDFVFRYVFFGTIPIITPPFESLNFHSKIFVIFTNVFIIGQDISAFLGPDATGAITFATGAGKNLTYSNLVVQSWSTASEFTFYLLAPFLVNKKTKTLLLLILGSLLIRLIIHKLDLRYQPWGARFFPAELGYFIMGIFSYRIYKFIESKRVFNYHLSIYPCAILPIIILTSTVCYPFLSNNTGKRSVYFQNYYQIIPDQVSAKWIYLIFIFLAIPFLFALTSNMKFDKFLGDLTYPVFISHMLAINIIALLFGKLGKPFGYMPFFGSTLALILSILISLVLLKHIINPIDEYRQGRLKL